MVDRSIVMWLFTRGYLSLSWFATNLFSETYRIPTGSRAIDPWIPIDPARTLSMGQDHTKTSSISILGPMRMWYIYIYTHTLFFSYTCYHYSGWLVGRSVGWLVERLTAVAVVHRHNLHQQISGSAPETSLLPSPPASGGLLGQKQEQSERNDAKQKKTPHNPKKKPLTS